MGWKWGGEEKECIELFSYTTKYLFHSFTSSIRIINGLLVWVCVPVTHPHRTRVCYYKCLRRGPTYISTQRLRMRPHHTPSGSFPGFKNSDGEKSTIYHGKPQRKRRPRELYHVFGPELLVKSIKLNQRRCEILGTRTYLTFSATRVTGIVTSPALSQRISGREGVVAWQQLTQI